MAIIQIPNLPAVVGLSGSELFEGVQSGSSVKISLAQITAWLQLSNGMISFPIQPSVGGTGLTSYTTGDIIYASGATTLAKLPDIATGNALITGGVGVAPSYGKIGLTTHISGTLPVANGGTNLTSYTTGDIIVASAAGTLARLNDVATGNALISGGVGATPLYGKIGLTTHVSGTLPVANGGTGVTTSTGSGAVVLGTGPTISTPTITSPTITSGVYNGTVGATTPSTGVFTTVRGSTSILSSGVGGVGYTTGAGVAVTQLTSRTTPAPTTGNKTSGAVTLFTAAPVVGTYFSFTVPNTAIAVTDTVSLSVRGATNTYVASVTAITAATSFQVTMASVAGTASDTPIVNFNIIRGVTA